MADSTKPVGRLEFASKTLLVSTLDVALEYLLRGNVLPYLDGLPRQIRALPDLIIFYVAVIFLGKTIRGRLVDSGLPRWYSYAAFAVWVLSTQLPIIWTRYWPIALALFLLLLITGSLIPSRNASGKRISLQNIAEARQAARAPDRKIPPRLLVGPVGYLRSLLTFACIALPLIWLKNSSGLKFGVLIAHLGYGLLYLVWLFKVLGRFGDSGRSSNGYWFSFCAAASTVSMLPLSYRLVNEYEALTIFLLIQVPLALLPSKPKPEKPVHPESLGDKYKRRHGKDAKPLLVDPSAFLLRIGVVVCLWSLLIYMESAAGSEVGIWFVRFGYFILGFAWMVNANGRLEDAGWAHSWYPSQYCLVVAVASLMPLAVHWVNGYGALVIFVLIQIPTLFLRSKPRPEDPLSDGTSLDEPRAAEPRS